MILEGEEKPADPVSLVTRRTKDLYLLQFPGLGHDRTNQLHIRPLEMALVRQVHRETDQVAAGFLMDDPADSKPGLLSEIPARLNDKASWRRKFSAGRFQDVAHLLSRDVVKTATQIDDLGLKGRLSGQGS